MKTKKRRTAKIILSFILVFCFTIQYGQLSQAKSSSYWLYGEGSSAGGDASIVYRNGKFHLTGSWGKGKTRSKAASKYYQSSRQYRNRTLKKAKNFRLGEDGIDGVRYTSLSIGYFTGTNLSSLSAWVKIKNKKVVRIIQSA